MKCFGCKKDMVSYTIHTKKDNLSYDVCEDCGSFWLDAGELNKMAFQVVGDIEVCSTENAKDAPGMKKACPRCKGEVLERVRFLGCTDIILDRCGICGGYWLDGEELKLINNELRSIMPIQGKGFSQFVNDVHIPFWYKKIRRQSSEIDHSNIVPPIKGGQKKSKSSFKCPACSKEMNVYSIYGIDVEGCPACNGVFLDKGELRKLKDRSEKGTWGSLRWLDDEMDGIENARAMISGRFCPKCEQTRMFSTAFGDAKIVIEWCPSCNGIWLDHGEYSAIIKHLKDKLAKMSTSDLARKAYEEIKEIWNGPEDKMSEILDAKAAIWALINVSILNHPNLTSFMLRLPRV